MTLRVSLDVSSRGMTQIRHHYRSWQTTLRWIVLETFFFGLTFNVIGKKG